MATRSEKAWDAVAMATTNACALQLTTYGLQLYNFYVKLAPDVVSVTFNDQ